VSVLFETDGLIRKFLNRPHYLTPITVIPFMTLTTSSTVLPVCAVFLAVQFQNQIQV